MPGTETDKGRETDKRPLVSTFVPIFRDDVRTALAFLEAYPGLLSVSVLVCIFGTAAVFKDAVSICLKPSFPWNMFIIIPLITVIASVPYVIRHYCVGGEQQRRHIIASVTVIAIVCFGAIKLLPIPQPGKL